MQSFSGLQIRTCPIHSTLNLTAIFLDWWPYSARASKTGKTADALAEILRIHNEQVIIDCYTFHRLNQWNIGQVQWFKWAFWILLLLHFVFAICLTVLKMWTGYLWTYVLIWLLFLLLFSKLTSIYNSVFNLEIGNPWYPHQAHYRSPRPSCLSAWGCLWIFQNLHCEYP